MSQIDSRHWKISTGRHFQNGHHNTAKIQHCPISSKFYMWVDNDVPNWFPTLKNFYRSPFSKWTPQYRTNSTLSDFNEISYLCRLWCPEHRYLWTGPYVAPFFFSFFSFFFNIDFFSYKKHFATFYVSLYDIYTINTIKQ